MIIMGLFSAILTVCCASKTGEAVKESANEKNSFSYHSVDEGIFSCKTGKFEIYMLVESQRDGNASILVGAGEDVLNDYIPAEGFKHSANAFLIKADGKNILIDTGTGAQDIIIEKVKKLGVEAEKVDAVLITHLHGDHFGSLQKDGKARFPNAKVYLSSREYDYFTKTNPNQGAVDALAPYTIITFEPAKSGEALTELMAGISPIAAYGHTPGHTVYLIGDFLVIGDLLHVALVQFPLPDISASYDMDKEAAALTRREILNYAANNQLPVGGMHVVYPGMGNVEKSGNGFKFIPAE
jgi:glyoxylase-like metal-dependent hydrolase (beta-lactamase superfamily II)